MLCENCGKNNANVKYTQIINGEKKQMFLCEDCSQKLGINDLHFNMPINLNGRRRELNLCEECSQKLGVGQMDFSMPIDFSSFLGGFMDELTTPSFMPMLNTLKQNKCNNCKY